MENFRIESLEINKIGAFEHLKMDFPKKTDPEKAEIHILTGENGTGKSTILEALTHYIVPFLESEELEKNRFQRLLLKFNDPEKYNITFTNSLSETINLFLKPPIEKQISHSSTLYYANSQDYKNHKFNCAFFAYSGYRKIDNYNVLDISKPLNNNPFEDALDFSKSTNIDYLLNWIGNYLMKSALAISQNEQLKSQKIIESVSKIYEVIENIIEKEVRFKLDEDLQVVIIIDGVEQHFNTIPDGVRSIVSWVGDLIMRLDRIPWNNDTDIFDRNFILFLDEIEVHLHPAWQRKILPVVQKLFKNAQIFISTHSPFVVGSVDGAWVHKLKKVGAYAVLDGEPVLSEDGKSVRRILDEVFGINEQYGINVEDDLKKFRVFRQKIMMGQDYNHEEFDALVKHLASQSTELEQMMGMEMNQLRRITQKELI